MKGCIFCVEKHVGKAMALMSEAKSGYRGRISMAIGELACAEDEASDAGLAIRIRQARKKLEFYRSDDGVDWEVLLTDIEYRANKADKAESKKPCNCGASRVEAE